NKRLNLHGKNSPKKATKNASKNGSHSGAEIAGQSDAENGGHSRWNLQYSKYPGIYKDLETGNFWTETDIKIYESKNPGDFVFLLFQTDEIGSELEINLTRFISGVIEL
ncbi:MAG: hypothetical protein JNL88_04400, partial [Bacteroidia bacterium]|nr:hypothetical protein [Bacteroidia bacterium]